MRSIIKLSNYFNSKDEGLVIKSSREVTFGDSEEEKFVLFFKISITLWFVTVALSISTATVSELSDDRKQTPEIMAMAVKVMITSIASAKQQVAILDLGGF